MVTWLRVFIAFAAALAVLTPLASRDLWWQLASGQWMLQHGEVLARELHSFTAPNAPWVNFAWLFQVCLALVDAAAGIWGLLAFKLLILIAMFYLLALVSASRPRDFPPLVVALLAMLPVIVPHELLRPHLLGYLGLAALVWLFSRAPSRGTAVATAVLLLIWANVHPSVVVAAAAVGIHVLLDPKVRAAVPSWRGRLALVAGVGVLPLCSPFGLDILHVLFSHARGESLYYIQEWLAPTRYPWILFALLVTYLLSVLGGLIRFFWGEAFLIGFFALQLVAHTRFEGELCVLLVRPTVAALRASIPRLERLGRHVPLLTFVAIGLVIVKLYPLPVPLLDHRATSYPFDYRQYPTSTATVLASIAEQADKPIRVLNSYQFGGFLEWRLGGEARFFIDGRTPTIYDDHLLTEYMLAINKRAAFDKTVSSYAIDAVCLDVVGDALKISIDDPAWKLVAYDRVSNLYVRRDAAFARDWEALAYNPRSYGVEPRADWAAQTRRLLAADPDNELAWLHLALQLPSTAEGGREAAEALSQAHRLDPQDDLTTVLLAKAIIADGRPRTDVFRVLGSLPSRLARGEGYPRALQAARAYLMVAAPRAALSYLYPKAGPSLAKLDRYLDAWVLRSWAESDLGRLAEAEFSLKMARLLAAPGQQRDEEVLRRLSDHLRERARR